MAEDLHRRSRTGGEVEDFIITCQEPSLPPPMITTTSDDNKNNNNIIRRGEEANPKTENTEDEELEEDKYDIEKHPA
jgi:hypothetical protein